MTLETPSATQRNQGFDLLRIVAICAVVAIHTFGSVAQHPVQTGVPEAWVARALSFGSIWSVPVFVMISGALTLGDRPYRDGIGPFYARRARRIIPALVFWTLVYLIVFRVLVFGDLRSGWAIVGALVSGSVYPHLYFLWLIAGLYLVAPVLRAFLAEGGVRRSFVFALSALGLTLVVFALPGVLGLGRVPFPLRLTVLTFWLAYAGYFLMGYALSRVRPGRVLVVVAGILMVVLDGATIVQAAIGSRLPLWNAFSPVDYLAPIVAVLSICVFIVGTDLLGRIRLGPRLSRFVVTASEASFGVYLIHLAVLFLPFSVLRGFHEQRSLPEAAVAYVFILVVSFAVSIGARRVPFVRAVF